MIKYNSISSIRLKPLMSLKLRSQRYLKNRGEPKDKLSHDSAKQDETVLTENSPVMRQNFRQVAQRIRAIRVNRIK